MQALKSARTNTAFRIRRLRHTVSTPVREAWYRAVRSPVDEVLWTLWDKGYLGGDRVLTRRNVISHLPEETLLDVSPAHVEHFVPFESSKSRRRFVWPGNWEERATPIREHHRYKLMEDALHYRNDLRQSPSFRQFLHRSHGGKPRAIANKGLLLVSEEQIEAFLRDQVNLLDSIAEQGVRSDLAVDEINVAVGRNGNIYKVNAGRKRTMAAKLLGLESIPVRVTQVHPEWIIQLSAPGKRPRLREIIESLEAVRDLYRASPQNPWIQESSAKDVGNS